MEPAYARITTMTMTTLIFEYDHIHPRLFPTTTSGRWDLSSGQHVTHAGDKVYRSGPVSVWDHAHSVAVQV